MKFKCCTEHNPIFTQTDAITWWLHEEVSSLLQMNYFDLQNECSKLGMNVVNCSLKGHFKIQSGFKNFAHKKLEEWKVLWKKE